MTNLKAYNINKDKQYILEYYGGKFDLDELIEFKLQIANEISYNPNFNIIHDFRDAEFGFSYADVKKYVETLQNTNHLVGNRKSVTITQTPNQVITSVGFEMQKKNLPIPFKTTSTIDAAIKFAGLAESEIILVETWFKMNNLKLQELL